MVIRDMTDVRVARMNDAHKTVFTEQRDLSRSGEKKEKKKNSAIDERHIWLVSVDKSALIISESKSHPIRIRQITAEYDSLKLLYTPERKNRMTAKAIITHETGIRCSA